MEYLRTRSGMNRIIKAVSLVSAGILLTACSGGKEEVTTASSAPAGSSESLTVAATEATESAEVVNAHTLLGKLLETAKSDNVHIDFMLTTENSQMESEIYISGGKTCLITTDKNGAVIKDIIKDGKTYMIIEKEKIYVMTGGDTTSDFINSAKKLFGMDGTLYFTGVTGEEEFCGEKLYFEEFMRDNKKANLNRFYYKDNVLQGCYAASGAIINVYAFDDEIPDGIFEIPEGYAERYTDATESEQEETDNGE